MELEQFKQAQRNAWSGGDYRPVGRLLQDAASTLVEAAGITVGQRVLDVATGSGNVAVAAAQAGASVVGVDITDACFDEAEARAEQAGAKVELKLGDAEQLPVDDAAFDVVASSFGAIFAPRHQVVAAEFVRVSRPGGTIAFTAWTPGGTSDRTFSVLTERLPEPPDYASSPILWGEPDYVRELFAPHDVEFTFEHRTLPVEFGSPEAFESFVFTNSGPIIAAREALRSLGRWDEAQSALLAAIAESNEADDGTYRTTWDYLLAVGVRR